MADELLGHKLAAHGAVAVEGTVGSGKSSTFRRFARSVVALDAGESSKSYLELAQLKPSALLTGPVPRLLDEWQQAPALRNTLRDALEARPSPGSFLLSSSLAPEEALPNSANIAHLRMRPMSLAESGESTGRVSLSALFNEELNPSSESQLEIEELARLICRGGWPGAMASSRRASLQEAARYVERICCSDISLPDGVTRNPDRARQLLAAYARALAAPTKLCTMVQDMAQRSEAAMSEDTATSYLRALKRLFVVEELPAWQPRLRTQTAIRTADARYFTDPSIAPAALGLSPKQLLSDLESMGRFFKNLCIRDLRVYAEAKEAQVFHYRDKNGLSCDAVIQRPDGWYGLIQIRLGGDTHIEQAAKSLHKLERALDTKSMNFPAFKMVLTGVGRCACCRRDGVIVVPIGALTR